MLHPADNTFFNGKKDIFIKEEDNGTRGIHPYKS